MKKIHEMTGTERAAALLVSLGPETAGEILKHLDEESVDLIATEIARIKTLSPEDREDLSGEFIIELNRARKKMYGGERRAREILEGAFGQEKADSLLQKLLRKNVENEFEFLNRIESEILASFLKEEHPQTIAVALSYLPADKSASIISLFPTELSKIVAVRMAKMKGVSPEAVSEIAKNLKKRYNSLRKQGYENGKTGGVDALVDILNNMNGDTERRIMGQFDSSIPSLSKQIRDRIFTFENIVNLTNPEVRILIDEINNDRMIAAALKGAGDDIRFKVVRNLSQNRATDLIEEMEAMGPLKLTEVEDARNYIVSIMRTLNDNDVISLRKDNEIYVE